MATAVMATAAPPPTHRSPTTTILHYQPQQYHCRLSPSALSRNSLYLFPLVSLSVCFLTLSLLSASLCHSRLSFYSISPSLNCSQPLLICLFHRSCSSFSSSSLHLPSLTVEPLQPRNATPITTSTTIRPSNTTTNTTATTATPILLKHNNCNTATAATQQNSIVTIIPKLRSPPKHQPELQPLHHQPPSSPTTINNSTSTAATFGPPTHYHKMIPFTAAPLHSKPPPESQTNITITALSLPLLSLFHALSSLYLSSSLAAWALAWHPMAPPWAAHWVPHEHGHGQL